MAWRSVIGSIVAVLMTIMDIQITNAAIGPIQAALHAPLADASWISSAYLIAEIVTLPLTGLLSRRLGYRRYAQVFSVMFMAASVLCAQSTSFEMLVGCRLLQGVAGGALMPLAYSLIMTRLPDGEHGRAMSLFGAMVTLAPMLGPVMGGFLTAHFGWASIFYLNLPIGLVGLALMMSGLRDEPAAGRERTQVDWPGLVLIVIGLGSLQYVLEEGNRYGWFASRDIAVLTGVALVALAAFVVRERASAQPLVALGLLANRQLRIACAANVTTGAAVFGTYFLVPYFLIELQRYTPAQISLVILYGGAVQLSILGFIPRILKRVHVHVLVVVGALLSCISAWMWSLAAADFSYASVVVAQLLRGLGFTLMLTPLGVLATTATVKHDAPSASILFNISRSLGGAIGVALLTALVGIRHAAYLDGSGGAHGAADDRAGFVLAFGQTFAVMAGFLAAMALAFAALHVRQAARERQAARGA
ncbi:hypothetical protein WI38_18735 [Burkholderia ubonensis]|uniref:Major facilitator superfamily (MFS) profile domain-containing protein n=1 Tax=Burkholderia ubonensis TaxID=101571 RepID=A0A102LAF5_9BURK|nr:DHA2 family efflux MFS transporter permease subunit [Burkholderia ubonensis]KUZ70213.1 hypothetical protein WI35_17090 [Burkholderia ubonensis]KUZ88805.1 hypothetical protein WI38_18735 [Burkholderia ubonensis]KUZ90140.1 hypothetical protein WI39_19600 [Burkholderia ubonensis]